MKYLLIIFVLFLSLPVFERINFSAELTTEQSKRESKLNSRYQRVKQSIVQKRISPTNTLNGNFASSVFPIIEKSLIEVLLAGELDVGFGSSGKVTTQFDGSTSEALAVARQSDGKFVLAGYSANSSDIDFALARYNENGTLDTSFGTGGKVTTDIGNDDNTAMALVFQPADGKLVAAGNSFNGRNDDFALVRYNSNGTLDETFGTGGKVTTDFNNSFDNITAIALQSDGKIVAAGYIFNNAYFQFGLARYNIDGTLDGTFGTAGRVMTRFSNLDDLARAIALQSDGKIIVAGEADSDFAVARYNADGSLDTTFDADGKARTSLIVFDAAYAVAIQPDGKIVAVGEAGNGNNTDFGLVRYNADGSLDTTFDADGKATTPIGSSDEIATSVALQADGKIIVGGFSFNSRDDDFAVVRYNTDGSLDSSFGMGGKTTTSFGKTSNDYVSALTIQSTNRLIAVGSSNFSFAIAALNLAPSYEADVSPRGIGDGFVSSTDVSIIQGFQLGLGLPYQSNEFQRADCAPFETRGDGQISSIDVSQAQAYQLGFNLTAQGTFQPVAGPTPPPGNSPQFEFDVLRNPTPSEEKNNLPEFGDSGQAPRTVRVVETATNGGQTVGIPIEVDAVGDEGVYGFSLDYDQNKLSNPVVSVGTAGGSVSANTARPGRIGISVNFGGGTIAAGNSKVLITVHFKVANNAAGGRTPISLTDRTTFREVASAPGAADGIRALPTTFTDGALLITTGKSRNRAKLF